MCDYLSQKNPHPRDIGVSLEESTHLYNINGDFKYMSVTTWNNRHYEKFDADKIIDKMMASKNWINSKYYGQTSNEIKDSWSASALSAAALGTKLHYDIERFYNLNHLSNHLSNSCYNDLSNSFMDTDHVYFMNFYNANNDLKPYRTEWIVYHEDVKIAGSIDMIFENGDGSLDICDWKRCKEIVKTNGFNKWATTECINHLPDTNYWHYALQLNIYKRIIEDKYGKTVRNLYLVCLHPDNKNGDYQKIVVPVLKDEIDKLFIERLAEINNLDKI